MGVDTLSDPDVSRLSIKSNRSVNITYRGDLASTRPAFREWNLKFFDSEDKEEFEKGNISGVYFYRGAYPFSTACIIVAVGNRILRGEVFGGTIEFFNLYTGIDRKWQRSFFINAEEILVWQNGKDYPLYWDGKKTNKMKPVYSSSLVGNTPMPIGNIMTYAHGRIFVATEQDLVYASNHFYSQGIGADKREAVLKFSESTYPSSGDGFGAPSDLGQITYMNVVPRNPSTNGHGEVIVGCQNGWFAINPTLQRNEWTRNDIQTIVENGKGNASPTGAVIVNGDIWFRDTDNEISTLRTRITEDENDVGESSVGADVTRYLNYDTPGSIESTFSGMFNRYLFFTVGHKKEESYVEGVFHRFSTGMVVADINRGSSFDKRNIRWDGLWTGPRVTGMIQGIIGGMKKGFVFSYGTDGINRIFSISNERQDFLNKEYKKIKSHYLIGSLFDTKEPSSKTLERLSLTYKEVFESTDISIDYSSDSFECFSRLDEKTIGCDSICDQSIIENPKTKEVCHDGNTYRTMSGKIVTKPPCENDDKNGLKLKTGSSFSVKINIEGFAKIVRCDILSNKKDDIPMYQGSCPDESSHCNGVVCCDELEFQYQF